jgi:succinylarginine dihydrolase
MIEEINAYRFEEGGAHFDSRFIRRRTNEGCRGLARHLQSQWYKSIFARQQKQYHNER